MAIAFPDLDPYAVLEVAVLATPLEIKKAYKRLSLRYHPDKIQQASSGENTEQFPRVQFAYSILSDAGRRSRYDATGLLGESDSDEVFDWKAYFDSINDKITIDMIDEDRLKYQGLEEEKADIGQNFVFYDGDFLKLFEVIPHLEFDEALEMRVYGLVDGMLEKGEIDGSASITKSWTKYQKSRKTKVKQMLKKLAKEAKEADQLAASIRDKGKKNLQLEDDLKSLIQSRQSNRLDDLLVLLELKYVKKGKKRGSRDISDADFDSAQQKLMKKKR